MTSGLSLVTQRSPFRLQGESIQVFTSTVVLKWGGTLECRRGGHSYLKNKKNVNYKKKSHHEQVSVLNDKKYKIEKKWLKYRSEITEQENL